MNNMADRKITLSIPERNYKAWEYYAGEGDISVSAAICNHVCNFAEGVINGMPDLLTDAIVSAALDTKIAAQKTAKAAAVASSSEPSV
jgi:hypothetical protein